MKNNKNKKQISGFSLPSIMMALSIATIVAGGSFVLYRHVSNSNALHQATHNLQTLDSIISNSYAVGGFSNLSSQSLVSQHVAPNTMLNAQNRLSDVWGGSVDVGPISSGLGSGYAITFNQVPDAVCSQFAANEFSHFDEVKVNGLKVNSPSNTNCASTSSLSFVTHSTTSVPPTASNLGPDRGAKTKTIGVAPTPLAPQYASAVASTPMASPTAPTMGAISPSAISVQSVSPSTVSVASISGNTPIPSTPSTKLPTKICVPNSKLVGSSSTTQTGTQQVTETGCTGGWVGSRKVVDTQQRTRTNTVYTYQNETCPNGSWGNPSFYNSSSTSYGNWGPWVTTNRNVVTNTCHAQATCSPPSTTRKTQYQTSPIRTNGKCPTGQSGSYYWYWQQSRIATVSWYCPNPTGSPISTTTYSSWSSTGVKENVTNTCATTQTSGGCPGEPKPPGCSPANPAGWICPNPTGGGTIIRQCY